MVLAFLLLAPSGLFEFLDLLFRDWVENVLCNFVPAF